MASTDPAGPAAPSDNGPQQYQQEQRRGTPSQTQAQTQTETELAAPILRLRGAHVPGGPRVQWAEDVVDNEGLGRKSSKVCCIYHRPRTVDESSDSSDSSSSSDSSNDSDSDDGSRARPVGGGRRSGDDKCGGRGHGHDHKCGSHRDRKNKRNGSGKRRPSPNAYEKMPKYDKKPEGRSGNGGDGRGGGGSSNVGR